MNKKCMTIFFLLLGTFLVPQITTADEEILSQRWSRIYNGIADGAWDVAAPDDETVFALSSSRSVVVRFDAAGNLLWKTPPIDKADAFALAYNPNDGGIYVAGGIADSVLPGQTALGVSDAYIIKYDGSGNVLWSRQFGTPDGEAVFDLAIDESGVYAAVSYALPALDGTRPAVWKFDHAGQSLWMRPAFDATVDSAFAIDVSEDGIFVAGSSGSSAALEFLSHAGVRQWMTRLRQGSGFSVARAVAVNDDGIYLGGMFGSTCSGSTALGHIRYCPGDAFVAKFAIGADPADPLWTVSAIDTGADSLEDIALGSDRLTLVGTVHESRNDRFRGKPVVEQMSLDGDRLAMTVFSAERGEIEQAQAVAVPSADTVYVAGRAGGFGNASLIDAFLSRFEPGNLLAKSSFFIRALGDINGDGSQDIVALFTKDGTLTATIKDAEDRHWIKNIKFDSSDAVDLKIMADINGNGAPELVVLGTGPAQSEVRDSLTGEKLGAVDFDPALLPIDLELVEDQTGNGIPELAMLGQNAMKVEVKDPVTKSTVNTLNFSNNYVPKDLAVWPHGGAAAVGVLGESKDPTRGDKVEVRDLDTGKIIQHLWVGKPWDLLQMELLADLNGNGSPELAVLRQHQDDQSVSVLPIDTATGARFRQLGFDPNYRPVRLRVLDDINGNGSEEIAVLAVRRGCCNQKVWVKDAKTWQSIRVVYFGKQYIGEDMDISPDINGNGAPELVVLGRRDDGVLRAYIKDSKTGELISSVGF